MKDETISKVAYAVLVAAAIAASLTLGLLLFGCAEAPSGPVAQAVDAPVLNRCPEGNYYARLRPEISTELLLPASIYDGNNVYVEFSIRYRGNFNGEGHAYGRHWTWDWKFHNDYSYYRDFSNGSVQLGSFTSLCDSQWHSVKFRRVNEKYVSITIDGRTSRYDWDKRYNPSVAEQRVLAFKSMDADIDDLFIVVDGKRVGWWDFEGNFVNEAGYGGYEFTGFEIVPYAGEQRYDG